MMVNIEMLGMWNASDIKIIINIRCLEFKEKRIYMKTDLFKIGGLTVHGYGFMIALGFILAMILGEYRAKKLGLKDESVIDIAIIAGLTGFAGAKLYL